MIYNVLKEVQADIIMIGNIQKDLSNANKSISLFRNIVFDFNKEQDSTSICLGCSKLMPEVDYAVLSEFYDFILQQENTKIDIIGKFFFCMHIFCINYFFCKIISMLSF